MNKLVGELGKTNLSADGSLTLRDLRRQMDNIPLENLDVSHQMYSDDNQKVSHFD